VFLGADGSDEMQNALHAATDATTAAQAAVALHRAVATSPSQLVLATTDDLAGMVERPNHPGTTNDQQPNWCRRLPVPVDALFEREPGAAITDVLRASRT
jgi:4-alpha-glucanotransferase